MAKKSKYWFLRVVFVTQFCFLLMVNLSSQIHADFSAPTLSGCGSLQVSFVDQSTASTSIVDWKWDLGVNSSSQQNPGVIYTIPGAYTICLTVTDENGNTDKECKEDYIQVLANPVASFSQDTSVGCVPVSVNFTNTSTTENGSIVSLTWDVGGSLGVVTTSDPDQIINSVYNLGGLYNASLSITDEAGCQASVSVPGAVDAGQLAPPDIHADIDNTCDLPWVITFTNKNMSPWITYHWDFGNGETFDGPIPPIITYNEAGAYDVTLYMESGDCRDTVVFNQFINTLQASSFDISSTSACLFSEVSFFDTSPFDAQSVSWDFGDGTSSSEPNPVHVYSSTGCHTVTLVRTYDSCADTVVYDCIEVLPLPDVSYDIISDNTCVLPAKVVLHGESSSQGTYTWVFDDGTQKTSIDSNDVVLYIDDYGIYSATLTFTDLNGCKVTIDSIEIPIRPFEAQLPTEGFSGCFPLTFTLSDSVITDVPIMDYQWIVHTNPPLMSNNPSPTFTIHDTGRYDVTLIVTNVDGCIDTVTVDQYIKVGKVPDVDFVASPLEACIADPKVFTDLSSSFVDQWLWEFGDGYATSTEQNPTVYFGTPDTFDITLNVFYNGCGNSVTFEDYIIVWDPVSRYEIEYNCDNPNKINITNLSLGADTLLWTIHTSPTDSIMTTDTLLSEFTFPGRGVYTLQQYTANYGTGCEHTRLDTIIITDPIAKYALDTLRGCAPLTIEIQDQTQDAYKWTFTADNGILDTIALDTSSILYTEGGIYGAPKLVISDIHECRDSFTLDDSIYVNQLIADAEYTSVICAPDSLLLIDLSTDHLGKVTSRNWNFDEGYFVSTDSVTGLFLDSVGIFPLSFYVEDDWGCRDSLDLSVNSATLIPGFDCDTLGCTFAPVYFSPYGVTSNVVDYLWDFGDGGTSHQKSPQYIYANEGIYTVCLTMYDGRGCDKTICRQNVVTIQDPVAVFTGDPVFATCPPLLTDFVNQSVNATSFVWDFGDQSGLSTNADPSHVFTQPGAYDIQLVATMTPACKDTFLAKDYINVTGPQGSFEANIEMSCIPVSVTLTAQSDGIYQYIWDRGNGIIDSVQGLTSVDTLKFEYDEPGWFTPKLIVVDSLGCRRTFAGDPIIIDRVDLDFETDPTPICGPPVHYNIKNLSTSTTDDVSYYWEVEGNQQISVQDTHLMMDISMPGKYDISLIAQYGACTDTLKISEAVEIATYPRPDFEITTTNLCQNIEAEFKNNTTLDYGVIQDWRWNFGDGDTSIIFEPTHTYDDLLPHTIRLTATSDKGCIANKEKDFTVMPSTIATVGNDQSICYGTHTTIEGQIENLPQGGQYYWIGDNMSCTDCLTPEVTPGDTAMYILVAVHPNGCESRDTVTVAVHPLPPIEALISVDDSICIGDEVVLSIADYLTDIDYQWNAENGDPVDCGLSCASVTVFPEASSQYYVIATDSLGCQNIDTVGVMVQSSFINFLPEQRGICEGDSILLEISAGSNPKWENAPASACIDCYAIEVSPAQTTYYYASVVSDLGCPFRDSTQVLVIPDSSAYAGPDREICKGEQIDLIAQGIGDPVWTVLGGIGDPRALETVALPEQSGYIGLTMTYDLCTTSDSFYVEIYDRADISAIGDTICVGDTIHLQAQGRADRIDWLYDDMMIQDTTTISFSPQYSTEVLAIGRFRTCIPDTARVLAYVHPHIDYYLQDSIYLLHLNDRIFLMPEYDTDRDYRYMWSDTPGLSCRDCPDPVISGIMKPAQYDLVVTDGVTDCYKDYHIQVRFVNECTDEVFYLPNIFSPDGDGSNDLFLINTLNKEEFLSMNIYDRWGNHLFSTENIDEGWDGSYLGQKVVNGVYVYRIDLICPFNHQKYTIWGDVTVVR